MFPLSGTRSKWRHPITRQPPDTHTVCTRPIGALFALARWVRCLHSPDGCTVYTRPMRTLFTLA